MQPSQSRQCRGLSLSAPLSFLTDNSGKLELVRTFWLFPDELPTATTPYLLTHSPSNLNSKPPLSVPGPLPPSLHLIFPAYLLLSDTKRCQNPKWPIWQQVLFFHGLDHNLDLITINILMQIIYSTNEIRI